MSDIVFLCPHCRQSLEAPPDMQGTSLTCPACNTTITVPKPRKPGAGSGYVVKQVLSEKKSYKGKIISLVIVLLIAYVTWPYVSLYRFYSALCAEDKAAVTARVDMPSLRLSLKYQLNALIKGEWSGEAKPVEGEFAGLAADLDSVIAICTTPTGMLRLLGGGFGVGASRKTSEGLLTPSSALSDLREAVRTARFSGLMRFRVTTRDMDFIFRPSGLTWKLIAVIVRKDALAYVMPAKTQPTQPEQAGFVASGKWTFKEEAGPDGVSKILTLKLSADEMIKVKDALIPPELVIKFANDKLSVYVAYDVRLGGDTILVAMRLGKEPIRAMDWGLSTDGKGVFYPDDTRKFLDELVKNSKLVLRLTPYGGRPASSTFDLTGILESVRPIMEALASAPPPKDVDTAAAGDTNQPAAKTPAPHAEAATNQPDDEAADAK
jgi:hypothetical protein